MPQTTDLIAPIRPVPVPGNRPLPQNPQFESDKVRDRRRFDELRSEGARLLYDALLIGHLSEIERAQLRAAIMIALHDFHVIPAVPEPQDARKVIKDLFDLARPIDSLVLAIGEDASCGLPRGLDLSDFRDCLKGAVDGNATCELECAAASLEDAREAAE